MRILMLTTYYKPDAAANGILMTQLAEELSARGHQVTVVTTMPHYDANRIAPEYRRRLWVRKREGDIQVHRVYLYVPPKKDRVLGRLLSYLSFNSLSSVAAALSGRPDVIFVPSPPLTNGVEGFLLSRLLRAPFIYNVQDIYPDVAIRLNMLRSRRAIRLFQAMERFVYRKAAAVSVISEGFRKNLLGKGVPESKLHVIPNFVDVEAITPLPRFNDFRRRQGLSEEFVALFAGNVGLSQGLETLLEAARLLEAQRDLLFLIVGNGAAKPGLVEQAERMGLENVRFLPYQPHEEVPLMYAAADLGLVPLRRGIAEESVPSKVLTILAAGRPLVAAVDCHSDTWQLVQQAECGLCVEPECAEQMADAVLSLYRDRERGRQMGARGRAFIEQGYTRKQVASLYEALFASVSQGWTARHS